MVFIEGFTSFKCDEDNKRKCGGEAKMVKSRSKRRRDDGRWKRVLIGTILVLIMVGSVVALMARI